TPRSAISVILRSPKIQRGPRDTLRLELLTQALTKSLSDLIALAGVGGVFLRFEKRSESLVIRCDGFTDKQPRILAKLLQKVSSNFTVDDTDLKASKERIHAYLSRSRDS